MRRGPSGTAYPEEGLLPPLSEAPEGRRAESADPGRSTPGPEPLLSADAGSLQPHARRLHRDPERAGCRRRLGSARNWQIFRRFPWRRRPEARSGSSPSTWTRSIGAGEEASIFAVPPETARAEEYLETLSDALLRRKKVTFTYHGIERNQETEREVRPYGLLFKHSHWYLVGWDETRDAQRIFRVDRMEKVQVNTAAPATPDYEMPPEPVLEAYRDREAWELGEGRRDGPGPGPVPVSHLPLGRPEQPRRTGRRKRRTDPPSGASRFGSPTPSSAGS